MYRERADKGYWNFQLLVRFTAERRKLGGGAVGGAEEGGKPNGCQQVEPHPQSEQQFLTPP